MLCLLWDELLLITLRLCVLLRMRSELHAGDKIINIALLNNFPDYF